MNKKIHYFGFIIIIFMMNACTVFQERNDHGFGGGSSSSWNAKRSDDAKAPVTNQESKLHLVLPEYESTNCLNTESLSVNQTKVKVLIQKIKHSNTKPNKLVFVPHEFKLKENLKELKSTNKSNSNWSIFRTILMTLGTLILIAGQTLAIIGGGSGNYYEIAMIGGLLLIFSIILLTLTVLKSYRNLGFWGKLGFWLIPCGIFTIGIATLLGIPLWIYGFKTGK